CLSAKRTAWNEFSCSMASAIICLATGRKFNFSKYIFDNMVRNVDSPTEKESKEARKEKEVKDFKVKRLRRVGAAQRVDPSTDTVLEGLHKGYYRFQSLLSQLKTHGAGVSTEDANQKFLRSLPSSWSQVSLIMRTKLGVDTLSFDDIYNNLRVFEFDVKGSTASSSSTQNVAFVSSDSTSSTNEVSNAYGVFTFSGHNSQREGSSSYIDELMYSFFANQSSVPQLDHKDLE
nr:hypothetical protein [Tanacetum cinerariifolium]